MIVLGGHGLHLVWAMSVKWLERINIKTSILIVQVHSRWFLWNLPITLRLSFFYDNLSNLIQTKVYQARDIVIAEARGRFLVIVKSPQDVGTIVLKSIAMDSWVVIMASLNLLIVVFDHILWASSCHLAWLCLRARSFWSDTIDEMQVLVNVAQVVRWVFPKKCF